MLRGLEEVAVPGAGLQPSQTTQTCYVHMYRYASVVVSGPTEHIMGH